VEPLSIVVESRRQPRGSGRARRSRHRQAEWSLAPETERTLDQLKQFHSNGSLVIQIARASLLGVEPALDMVEDEPSGRVARFGERFCRIERSAALLTRPTPLVELDHEPTQVLRRFRRGGRKPFPQFGSEKFDDRPIHRRQRGSVDRSSADEEERASPKTGGDDRRCSSQRTPVSKVP